MNYSGISLWMLDLPIGEARDLRAEALHLLEEWEQACDSCDPAAAKFEFSSFVDSSEVSWHDPSEHGRALKVVGAVGLALTLIYHVHVLRTLGFKHLGSLGLTLKIPHIIEGAPQVQLTFEALRHSEPPKATA